MTLNGKNKDYVKKKKSNPMLLTIPLHMLFSHLGIPPHSRLFPPN